MVEVMAMVMVKVSSKSINSYLNLPMVLVVASLSPWHSSYYTPDWPQGCQTHYFSLVWVAVVVPP